MIQLLAAIPFIQEILESVCLSAMFFVLLRMKLEWWKIVLLGAVFALLSYLVGMLPLVEGEPTLVLIFLQSLILSYMTREYSYVKVLFAVVPGTALLTLVNALFDLSSPRAFHITFNTAGLDAALRPLLGLVHIIAGFMAVLAVYYFRQYQDRKRSGGLPLGA